MKFYQPKIALYREQPCTVVVQFEKYICMYDSQAFYHFIKILWDKIDHFAFWFSAIILPPLLVSTGIFHISTILSSCHSCRSMASGYKGFFRKRIWRPCIQASVPDVHQFTITKRLTLQESVGRASRHLIQLLTVLRVCECPRQTITFKADHYLLVYGVVKPTTLLNILLLVQLPWLAQKVQIRQSLLTSNYPQVSSCQPTYWGPVKDYLPGRHSET